MKKTLARSVKTGGASVASLRGMRIEELRFALSVLISEEEASNWDSVEALSQRIYVRLTTEDDTPQDYPREDVIGYLAGYARRQSDDAFRQQQHRWLRSYLDPARRLD
jgi:hypothetical protein